MAGLIQNDSVNKPELKKAIAKVVEVLKDIRVPNYTSAVTFEVADLDAMADKTSDQFDMLESSVNFLDIEFDPTTLNTQAIKGATEEIQAMALVSAYGMMPNDGISDFNSVKLLSWQLTNVIQTKVKAIPYFEDNKIIVSAELSFEAGHEIDPLDTQVNSQHTTCNLVLKLYPM
jgi:hypothetical protein